MIGTMSAATVRAAQLGRIFIFASDDLLRQPRHRRDDVRARRPGSPMSAESIPSASIRWRIADLLLDRGALDRGRLQAVAQRLVVELDASRGRGTPLRRRGSSRR